MIRNKPTFKIVFENKLILVKTDGAPSAELMQAMKDEAAVVMNKKNAPKDILVTTDGIGILGPKAFKVAVQSLNEVPFRRLAICGNKPSRIAPAKNIAHESDKKERIKIFRNEDDARAWLEEEAQPIRTKIKQQTSRLKPIHRSSLGNFILSVVIIPPT